MPASRIIGHGTLRQICRHSLEYVDLNSDQGVYFFPTAFVRPRGGSPFDGSLLLSDGVLPKRSKSFVDFNSLRTLRVTPEALLDLATSRAPDEFLPRRLEVLHFTGRDELVIPHLEILISNFSDTMSELENIRIDRWNLKIAWRYQQDDETWRSATAEEKQRIIGLKQIRDVCETAGVGFLVDHNHASNLVKTECWEDVLALL